MSDDLKPHLIELTQGLVASVSAQDFPAISLFKWHAVLCNGRYYARRGEKRGRRTAAIYMHRQILGGALIDHINGDSLDNRRENLRATTPSQNSLNISKPSRGSTGMRGVYAQGGKFLVRIGSHYGGFFDNLPEAAFHANELLDRLMPGVGLRNQFDSSLLIQTLTDRRNAIDAVLSRVGEP